MSEYNIDNIEVISPSKHIQKTTFFIENLTSQEL